MFKKCFKTIIAFVFCAIITASTSVAGMGMVEHTQVEKEVETFIFTDDGPSDFIKH